MLFSFRQFVFCLCLTACCLLQAEVSFNRQIKPIISNNCFKCHGPDAKNQDSEFRLDTAEHAYADLGGYFGIVPGDLAKSELVNRIHHLAEDQLMPPANSNLALTPAEKQLLEQWIKEGAKFEPHWSWQKLPAHVDLPSPSASTNWAHSPIDQFIAAGFADYGVGPTAETAPEKWLRRVSFDLTGLPPSLAEIDAFLADRSPQAYETVVDRLLASSAYAERMTTEWLDVARYSDTYGYQRDGDRIVWPWRDWVIAAFDQNMPYDRFITLQVAGDLLPDAGPAEELPTAFNRLHGHVMEGGIVPEEYRVEYVADRTHTFSTAFLGLTMECARCHDHKYDPLPTKDYYSLTSFFANIDESGLISFFTEKTPTPAMPLSTSAADAIFAQAIADELQAMTQLKHLRAETTHAESFETWLEFHRPPAEWPGLVGHLSFDEKVAETLANSVARSAPAQTSSENILVPGKFGQAMEFEGDALTHLPNVGHFNREDPFSFSVWLKPHNITARENIFSRGAGADDAASMGYEFLLIDGKPTASLIHFWPGNGIRVQALTPLAPDEWKHVVITYDGSSKAAGLKLFLDGKPLATRAVADHLTLSITDWSKIAADSDRQHIVFGQRYRDRGFVKGQLDEFYAFDRELTPVEAQQLFDGAPLSPLLAKDYQSLNADDRAVLFDYFLATTSNEARHLRQELHVARATWNQTMDQLPTVSIMRELAQPKPAYVLTRGSYDAHGEETTANTPSALPPFPADQPRNRLGLARWLTAPDHPLTARVAVNRYWQLMFGQGIVRTPEDFGSQGRPPTHPELLDWLARDFINSGWDLRHLFKQMVLSATYRQRTIIDAATREKDPENLSFCRSNPTRLEAEMIRDNVLAVSGLLVDHVGGPSVKPYELAVGFEPVEPAEGDGLYRRSLYTRSKRNSPAPVMITFDAPKRDVCSVQRSSVASPLQPLVTLNGPQFVEASRVLADTLLQKYPHDQTKVITEAFLRLTSRSPDADELALLSNLYDIQIAEFTRHPTDAAALLTVGAHPVSGAVAPPELAAATIVVNALMNLHESITHR
jgi:hypothetical protein